MILLSKNAQMANMVKFPINTLVSVSLFILVVLLGACGSDHDTSAVASKPVPAQRELRISGSSTMTPMLSALAKKFEALHPGIKFTIVSTGSKQGMLDVRAGTSAIAMLSRNLNDDEQDLEIFPIARDGLAIVLNKNNSVTEISSAQVVDIFTGKLINWEQLKGAPGEIHVITREPGRSSLDLITQFFKFKESDIKARQSTGNNQPTIDAVAANPQAISFLSLGDAERSAGQGAAIRLLAIDRTAASTKNVRNGNYPYLRPLSLVTKKLPEGPAKQFIDFCLSAQATEVVTQSDFIPYLD